MELALQRYLRGGKTLADLQAERGINVYRHPSLPLVGFKYSQLSFPKTDPVIRDCRGVVLEDGSWNLVARAFRRFFNAGEDPDSFAAFGWDDFTATTKEDGSLILLYHYADGWHVNTSGSFGLGVCHPSGRTWRDLFWETSRVDRDQLDPALTYVFELWTPHNAVVRIYDQPAAFLLTVFDHVHDREVSVAEADSWAARLAVPRPMHHHFTSVDEITAYLADLSERDRTFEGIVIRDRHDERLKVKSATYVALHHLKETATVSPRSLVPILLAGEAEELVTYLPQVRPYVESVQARIDAGFDELRAVWAETWRIPTQREFAQAIVPRTRFAPLLFTLRRDHGDGQTEAVLGEAWRAAPELILKVLF